jgi:hypothetical protein
VNGPFAVGRNITQIVQLEFAAGDAGHWPKSINSPMMVTLLIDTALVPADAFSDNTVP